MDNHYTLGFQSECKDLASSFSEEFCLPLKEICNPTPTDGILSLCSETYNCTRNRQLEDAYFHPYESGDLIQIQTQFFDFFNPDRTIPVSGWGSFVTAQLFDNNSNLLSTNIDDFASMYYVAWNGSNSFQVIKVDTSLPIFANNPCWSIRFRSFDDGLIQVEEYCSQDFGLAHECKDLITIKGEFDSFDCLGNDYRLPLTSVGTAFKYDNTLKYYAVLRDEGGSVTKTVVKDTRTAIQAVHTSVIRLMRLIPSWVKNTLLKQHIGAQIFYVDGVEYLKDSWQIENENTKNNLFYFDIEIQRVCETDATCA